MVKTSWCIPKSFWKFVSSFAIEGVSKSGGEFVTVGEDGEGEGELVIVVLVGVKLSWLFKATSGKKFSFAQQG